MTWPCSSLSEHLSAFLFWSPLQPCKQGLRGLLCPPHRHRLCCAQHPGSAPLTPASGSSPHLTTIYQNSLPWHEVLPAANCHSRKDPTGKLSHFSTHSYKECLFWPQNIKKPPQKDVIPLLKSLRNSEEGCACGGRVYMATVYFLFHFAVNLKTVKKKKQSKTRKNKVYSTKKFSELFQYICCITILHHSLGKTDSII